MRSRPKISSGRAHRGSFKDAWKYLSDLPFPTGGPETPIYMDLLTELAELDAFVFTWLNKMNDHSNSEIAAELSRVSEFENRIRLSLSDSGEPAKWQNLWQYVLAMKATLVASGIPASGV